jgi:hypothetical protein
MRELFTRYNPNTPPVERKGSPVCVVSYPESCGGVAVGEGWGCLLFCERHWQEELAAREELAYAVGGELDTLISAEGQRPDHNRAVVAALRTAVVPGWGLEDRGPYEAARAAAFPVEGRDDLMDPDAAGFDYDHHGEDVPSEWWEDARVLLLRFLRQTGHTGLPGLALELERLRERATVQIVLAGRDMEWRYLAPGARSSGRRNGRAVRNRSRFSGRGILAGSPGPSQAAVKKALSSSASS